MKDILLAFDNEIKSELKILFKDSVYDKTGILDARVQQIIEINSEWLNIAKRTYSANVIAEKLFTYDKNLK